jgi:hypothetical protein
MPILFKLIVGALCALAGASAAIAQTAFYRAPSSEVAGAPGTLIRQEVIDGAPLGATAYRVLYRSTGLDDQPSIPGMWFPIRASASRKSVQSWPPRPRMRPRSHRARRCGHPKG